ncbi:hypothetical protein [Marinobacter antarcticus]|uniref:hypothetical protein n=1 Tax=Marinobacter antarcticus TaxID=564117 RepID=UPI001114EF1B|nr:hypothetical protein [Marinobacter antarcticus]
MINSTELPTFFSTTFVKELTTENSGELAVTRLLSSREMLYFANLIAIPSFQIERVNEKAGSSPDD